MLKRFIASIAVVAALCGPAAAGPFEDGFVAHERGDFATALRLWRPLADQGDVRAQYNLGFMYENGRGVAVFMWWR